MKETLLVTRNFDQNPNHIFGRITFDTDSEDYKQLIKNPSKYNFELGYIQSDVDPEQVGFYELSMVKKK